MNKTTKFKSCIRSLNNTISDVESESMMCALNNKTTNNVREKAHRNLWRENIQTVNVLEKVRSVKS